MGLDRAKPPAAHFLWADRKCLWLWEKSIWQVTKTCLSLFCSFSSKDNIYCHRNTEELCFYNLQVNKTWGKRERSMTRTAWESSSPSLGAQGRRAGQVWRLPKNRSCSSQCLARQLSGWVRSHSSVLLIKFEPTFFCSLEKRTMCTDINHWAVVNK